VRERCLIGLRTGVYILRLYFRPNLLSMYINRREGVGAASGISEAERRGCTVFTILDWE
jgi:hypothetical protein